ncbi:MAG: hypothetical protein ACXVAX_08080 [Pseudobdellovibrio sp.]
MKALLDSLAKNKKTLLCVGPLSRNIIDVSLDFAKENDAPLAFVASRRQIDSRNLGCGYVNHWSTDQFTSYIGGRGSSIILERDHGGPWQGEYEVKNSLDIAKSMQAAKSSFEADIEAGFQLLHIDPTVPVQSENLNEAVILERLFELYGHVVEYAGMKNKKIYIEVGTEEQNGGLPDLQNFEELLNSIQQFCKKNSFSMPLFVVLQTGTKVVEFKNAGVFEQGDQNEKSKLIKTITDAVGIAKKYNTFVKEHNADYLSFENLSLRPKMGIAASNVAPEFGHIETKTLIHLLNTFGEASDREKYIEALFNSQKWKKWLSADSSLKKDEKAILAGHYCASNSEVLNIKEKLRSDLKHRDIDIDEFLKNAIRTSIRKYATAFGLV